MPLANKTAALPCTVGLALATSRSSHAKDLVIDELIIEKARRGRKLLLCFIASAGSASVQFHDPHRSYRPGRPLTIPMGLRATRSRSL